MLIAQATPKVRSDAAPPPVAMRVLMAPFKQIWLAIPMEASRKIIRFETDIAGLKMGDRVQIDRFSAQICRLYEHIYGVPNPEPESHGVVVHLSPTEILVIPMVQVPTIVDLPQVALQPILSDYRDLFMLEVASHIAALPQTDTDAQVAADANDKTVFLLDTAKLMDLIPAETD